MTKNHEKPPKMREPYSAWKLELDLWVDATDYTTSQVGPVIVLSLEGDAKDACLAIPKDELKSADGVKLILQKLDTLYEKDETQLAFIAFDRFVKYRRPREMDMNEFLRKFELMKSKCETYKFKIPDNILAYFMLSCANLPDDKVDIVRATVDELTVKNVRSKILSIYTDIAKSQSSTDQSFENSYGLDMNEMSIKEEPEYSSHSSTVLMGRHENVSHKRKGKPRRGSGRSNRGGYNSNRRNVQVSSPMRSKLNPLDKHGQPTRCDHCGSKFHWADDCPDYTPTKHFNSDKHYGENKRRHEYEEPL